MFQLNHAGEDCPGRWQRLEGPDRAVTWRCTLCAIAYPDGTAVRLAVLREYDVELLLARLQREGRHLLSGRRARDSGDG